MIPNMFSGCCQPQSYDESQIEFEINKKNGNIMSGIYKNLAKQFKDSQVSSYTEKLSIAKKLKQKKVQNSSQNNTQLVLFNPNDKNESGNSHNNESTKTHHQQPSLFINLLNRFQQSQKSLYQQLMSPRTLVESQVLNQKQFK